MDIKAVEQAVAKVQQSLFKKTRSMYSGIIKSHFKGMGLQYKEHRIYDPGDDTRFIDWGILAKTGETYIRTFEEERNLEITVLLDLSAFMGISYRGVSKFQAACEMVYLLLMLAQKNGDKIHIVLWGNELTELRPAAGKKGLVQLIAKISDLKIYNDESYTLGNLQRELDAKKSFAALKKFFIRKKNIIILSDYWGLKNFEKENCWIPNSYLSMSNVKVYQLTTPLEETEKKPFSFYGQSFRGEHSYFKMYSKGKKELFLSKKIKKISLKDNYIDKFVFSMQ